MKVSFGSWAFSFGPYSRHPIPLEKVAEKLAATGYDGIELCGFPPYVTPNRYPTPAERRLLASRLEGLNLSVSSYVPDFTMVNPVVEANRDRYLDVFRCNLEICHDLGSPSLRVDSIAAPGSILDAEYLDCFRRVAALWHDAAEIAATAGIRIIWEFEPGFVFNKPSEIVEMYERVGHPNFQILFDTGHAYLCGVIGARQHGDAETLDGGVCEFLQLLSGRIGHIHLADTDGTLYGDETTTHCPLGAGSLDWKRIGPLLKAIPAVEWWCVDLSFWPGSWDLLESSLSFVRQLMA
ncbi:MAG: sugar phosphate isomerase/epimerase [Bryobacteraceae bacterium]|nr:sugar phosphate isomerase/epimerase [Bryobacteraceae bacterium]MDW8380086.1 sugar phosphate isomerase/epimerase family protein [Bryobacterales bacterium]